jgi:K+-sensing histidine kinase KdpD
MTVTQAIVRTAASRPAGAARAADGVVIAAIDDDDNAGQVVAYARARSAQLRVPLRLVHVWTEARPHRIADADRLLSTVLTEHLRADEVDAAERQILHDRDPAHALAALSRRAALLVVGANSGAEGAATLPGDTTGRLAGHTGCPLVILPAARHNATSGRW